MDFKPFVMLCLSLECSTTLKNSKDGGSRDDSMNNPIVILLLHTNELF